MPTERITILGIPIDNLKSAEWDTTLARMLSEPRPHHITTPNPEFLVAARRDPVFAETLRSADLNIGDGVGLQYAALLQGKRLRRITGVDLLLTICGRAERDGSSVYLVGGRDQTAQRAARALLGRYPKLRVVGAESGGEIQPDGQSDLALVTKIAATEPKILLVAFGHPKQELWLRRHLASLPSVRIALGVGGAFDYLAGNVQRAPAPLRRLGLEWLYRLVREPWRWRRIRTAILIFPLLALIERLLPASRHT